MIIVEQKVVPDFVANDGSVVLEITREEDVDFNPRDSTDYGHMVCMHKNYIFGHEPQDRNLKNEDELTNVLLDILDEEIGFDSDQRYNIRDNCSNQRLMNAIVNHTNVVILPLYLMDHSGLSMSTSATTFNIFDSGGWDHGQVGFIYATTKEILSWYDTKEITEEIKKSVRNSLKSEIHTYDLYLRGEVYYFRLYNKDTDEDIDACGGFYSDDIKGLKEQLRDGYIPEEYQYLLDRLKAQQY